MGLLINFMRIEKEKLKKMLELIDALDATAWEAGKEAGHESCDQRSWKAQKEANLQRLTAKHALLNYLQLIFVEV